MRKPIPLFFKSMELIEINPRKIIFLKIFLQLIYQRAKCVALFFKFSNRIPNIFIPFNSGVSGYKRSFQLSKTENYVSYNHREWYWYLWHEIYFGHHVAEASLTRCSFRF